MRNAVVISLIGLSAASAYAIGLGAGGFYMVSTQDFGSFYEPSFLGGGAKVCVGVLPALSVDVGFGYNMKYKEKTPYVLWPPAGTDLDNWYLTTIPITFGASYKFDLGKVKPYVGAGGVFAMRKRYYELVIDPESPDPVIEPKTYSVNKPGFYVGGGVMYGLTDKLFLDANPRFLMLMYDEKEDADAPSVSKEDGNPVFVDILIGADYFFM
jgi:opacity protein-like surface antigen